MAQWSLLIGSAVHVCCVNAVLLHFHRDFIEEDSIHFSPCTFSSDGPGPGGADVNAPQEAATDEFHGPSMLKAAQL